MSCVLMHNVSPFNNGNKVILGTVRIWCLGSSIVKHAFTVARSRPGGISLGLDWAEVWWQGYSGLSLLDVLNKLRLLKQVGDEPSMILLHCGGNDLGKISLHRMRFLLDAILTFIHINFNVKVIWSEVLPRSCWRYSDNCAAMEKGRRRFNNYAAHKIVQGGGLFIKQVDLQECSPALYKNDGVHLTFLGNCIFLNQWASALEDFHNKTTTT